MKTWHAMVAVTLFSLQANAEGPQTLVALTRKSGVALARATQVAGEVSAVLQKSGVPVKGAPNMRKSGRCILP